MMLRAEQVIVDLKTRIFLGPAVGSAKVGQHIKVLTLLKESTYIHYVLARYDRGHSV